MTRATTTGRLLACAALATLLLAGNALASEAGAAVVGPREIVNTGVSLLLIIAAIMALAWTFTRLQGGRTRNGGIIRVIAAQPLGAKERVMLVDVAGRQLVIGVTASQIRTLHVLDEAVAATGGCGDDSPGFGARLKSMLQLTGEAER